MTTDTSTERDPLDIALDAIPAFRTIQAANDAVQQRITALRSGGGAPPVDLGREVLDALTAGEPVPADLGRRAWEAQQAAEFQKAELLVLQGTEARLKNKGELAVRAGADDALRALRPVLDELLDTARPLAAALRGVHDAQSAIDRGPKAVAAWSGFNKLVGRYASIRSAQYKITRASVPGPAITIGREHLDFAAVFPVWSEIANVTEVWPEWQPGRSDGKTVPPWPVLSPHKPFEVRHDREWFLWVLTHPRVRLWLPTLGELRKAYADQRDDARQRGGKPAKRVTGERLRRPVRVKGGDGSEWNEYQDAATAAK
ncbi:hypothetical protein GCM10010420_07380 [Streptomyces glaucosporus]|uniref:Uncharacterized protein n=1 Tax=Streptomyces glaucosporus TaxID=284044 RepID=A0ABP5UWX2_9ACTN